MDRDQMDELLAPIGQLGAAMAALEVTDAAAEKALQEVLAGTDATDDEAAQRRAERDAKGVKLGKKAVKGGYSRVKTRRSASATALPKRRRASKT